MMTTELLDVVVVGAGPAGLAAGIEAKIWFELFALDKAALPSDSPLPVQMTSSRRRNF
jgi:flavin-dependent dehydrogenase